MSSHRTSELRGKGEHHVEVRHRQHELTLPSEPTLGGVMTALRTGPMPARVIEQMLITTSRTVGQVPSQRGRATGCDGTKSTRMAWQQAPLVSLDVVWAVLAHDRGQSRHGLQVGHQAVDDLLQPLGARLGDVHV